MIILTFVQISNLPSFISSILVAAGLLDPGNFSTNIAAGSEFGYSLLWVLFLSNIFVILFQDMASRVGIVSKNNLAELCKYYYPPKISRYLFYLFQVAIIATDLAVVLGTAIALKLLIPPLPLFVCVLLTSLDTLLLLLIQQNSLKTLEKLMVILLGVVAFCFVIELFISKPNIGQVALGFIPTIQSSKALYLATALVGAIIMPHNLLIGSSTGISISQETDGALKKSRKDLLLSVNIAFLINASILIVAATVFYPIGRVVEELDEAHDLLEDLLDSQIAPIIFGIALFCSGQSSSFAGVLAAQMCLDGFLNKRYPPWKIRALTRILSLGPALIAVLSLPKSGAQSLIVLTQVVLSLQLPFAVIPLIQFASDSSIMGPWVLKAKSRKVSWTIVVLIISLNIYLVIDVLVAGIGLLAKDGGFVVVSLIILFVLGTSIFMGWLMLYLLRNSPSLQPEFENEVHHPEFGPIGGGNTTELEPHEFTENCDHIHLMTGLGNSSSENNTTMLVEMAPRDNGNGQSSSSLDDTLHPKDSILDIAPIDTDEPEGRAFFPL